MYTPPSIKPHPKTPNQRTWMAHEPTPQLSDSMVQPGGGEEADGAGVRVAADGPAAADSDARQPTVEEDGSETAVSATAGGATRGEGADAADGAAPHTAADVHMAEAGSGSAAGRATPAEGARADAATSTRASDTLHMHSVADTARRRVRGSQKSGKKRQLEASSRALAEEAAAVEAKRARAEPHPDT